MLCSFHINLCSNSSARWQRWINFGLQCSAGLFHCVNVLFFNVGFLLSHFLFYFVTLNLLILLIILLPVLTHLWLFAPSSLLSLLSFCLTSCFLVYPVYCFICYLCFLGFSHLVTFFVCYFGTFLQTLLAQGKSFTPYVSRARPNELHQHPGHFAYLSAPVLFTFFDFFSANN